MKTLVITRQKKVKGEWEPDGAKFFEVSDRVNVEDLQTFLNGAIYAKNMRLTATAREVRNSPQLLPHIEDLWIAFGTLQDKIRQAGARWGGNPETYNIIAAKAREEFREWCTLHDIHLDFTPKE